MVLACAHVERETHQIHSRLHHAHRSGVPGRGRGAAPTADAHPEQVRCDQGGGDGGAEAGQVEEAALDLVGVVSNVSKIAKEDGPS
jgi:hypothetical protein